jgi:hypothetical protein
MSPKRIGPLFLLILAGLLLAATWTTAAADERRPLTISPEPGMVDVPVFTPTSGEPDVGGTPAPRSKTNDRPVAVRAVASCPWSPLPPWVRLIMRSWSVWIPGLS